MIINILKKPIMLPISLVLGIYTGVYHPDLSKSLSPFANCYLSALQIAVIPIIITSIPANIARIVSSDQAHLLKKILVITTLVLLFSSALGLIIAIIAQPGVFEEIGHELAQMIHKSSNSLIKELPLTAPIEPSGMEYLADFIQNILPSNIFHAFTQGQIFQIIIFSIIFGLAISTVMKQQKTQAISFLDELQNIFQTIINGIVVIFPIGLFFLLADQISQISYEVIFSLIKFVIFALGSYIILFLLNSIIIWRYSTIGYWESIYLLRDPLLIAFSTRNSLVAMPTAIEKLTYDYKADPTLTNSLMTLGISLCRYGSILYFSFATIFIAQLYSIPLSFLNYMTILFLSVIAGIMSSGVTGIATLYMMSFILDPIGLPFEAVLILFIAVDPIIDPLRTLINVHTNCATTMIGASLK